MPDSAETGKNTVAEIKLESWSQFDEYIREHHFTKIPYIYRGQTRDWPLVSRFDRLHSHRSLDQEGRSRSLALHLENFKNTILGRRGLPSKPVHSDDEIWAIGQHWGLETPLLDWTESPFIAMYFAFEQDGSEDSGEYRAVYALSALYLNVLYALVESRLSEFREIMEEFSKDKAGKEEVVADYALRAICPVTEDNYRLVNQRAWFVKCESQAPIEEWARRVSKEPKDRIFEKILIKDSDRIRCLQWLDNMNINHASLFPDLYGAATYCNMARRIPTYGLASRLHDLERLVDEASELVLDNKYGPLIKKVGWDQLKNLKGRKPKSS